MRNLPEAFVLLTAGQEPDPWRGRREPRTRRALAAAVFAELLLRRRVVMLGDEVDIPPGEVTGDALLDGALARLEAAAGPEAEDLVGLLAEHLRGAGPWLLTAMASEGLIRRERVPYRRVFTQTTFVSRDSPQRRQVLADLRVAAGGGYNAPPRGAALLVLLREARLLDGAVPVGERTHLRDGAAALAAWHPYGKLVRAAMEGAPAPEPGEGRGGDDGAEHGDGNGDGGGGRRGDRSRRKPQPR